MDKELLGKFQNDCPKCWEWFTLPWCRGDIGKGTHWEDKPDYSWCVGCGFVFPTYGFLDIS